MKKQAKQLSQLALRQAVGHWVTVWWTSGALEGILVEYASYSNKSARVFFPWDNSLRYVESDQIISVSDQVERGQR